MVVEGVNQSDSRALLVATRWFNVRIAHAKQVANIQVSMFEAVTQSIHFFTDLIIS